MTLDLSIVIASYKTRELTGRCLRSIVDQTSGLQYEIIVVDNASDDGSAEMIEREFPDVRLVRNDRNAGFAAAQNIGLTRAGGRFLLVLNSDVLFVGNAAKVLVDFLRSAPEGVGVVGPQVLNADGSVAPSARRAFVSRRMVGLGIVNRHFRFKRLVPERFVRRSLGFVLSRWHDNYAAHDTIREVDFVDGICALFRREALERVGLFDEQFFFDHEINDLSYRIRAAGWRIVFFPGVQVIHLAHSSRKKIAAIVVETHRSELIIHAKYNPDLVPYIKRTVRRVVTLRKWVAAAMFLSRRSGELEPIYARILDLADSFDAAAVFSNERIPRLDTKEPSRTDRISP
jgi:GT2 family glycosyltransferase